VLTAALACFYAVALLLAFFVAKQLIKERNTKQKKQKQNAE